MLKSKINALLKAKSDMMKEMSHGGTSIEWKCTVKGEHVIILNNDYSESDFKITILKNGDIEVTDELMGKLVTYLLKGDEWFHDFQNEDDGIESAINDIFGYFYDRY